MNKTSFVIGEFIDDWSYEALPPLSHSVAAPLGQGSSFIYALRVAKSEYWQCP